ncbi:MAG: DUF3025 domain-containing protein [Sulfuricella sp.]|nr:DUF3025 domain-containing protein [Sulfuricella sp.]
MPKDPGPQIWQADFLDRSPIFAPLRQAGERLRGPAWPTLEALQPVAPLRTASGQRLRFAPHGPKPTCFAAQYEPRIFLSGEVPTRTQNWHDFFNALAWLVFPQAKAAINAAHYHAALAQQPGTNRHPDRHKLTLFDESGVAVACADPRLAELLREHRWKELFCEQRAAVQRAMRFVVFGHSLYEKALDPYVGLTGHGLIVEVPEDFADAPQTEQVAALDNQLAARLGDPQNLAFTPVPLLGVPGWWQDNETPAFYEDTGYFRPKRA